MKSMTSVSPRLLVPKFWPSLLLLLPGITAAQQTLARPASDSTAVVIPGAIVTAVRISGSAPELDGRVSDAEWKGAMWISGFTQREPVEGIPATTRTEVAFLYDAAALYIGARLGKAGSSPVRALVTRRDREGSSEQLIVSLDTYSDKRTAYSFGVTAAGVRVDYYHSSDAQSNRDYSYDPVWEAKTQLTSDGWTAEIRIPFTQLRFNGRGMQAWGVNVARVIPAQNEEDYLVLVKRNETGWSSRFAELRGIEGISASRRIELAPYVATDARLVGSPQPGNPFVKKQSATGRVGGDIKVGLGTSLTLDATINPDFGQVEADPAEVNLSAFETVFPERRPFFVEGSQLLRGGGLSWFQSRRIGQAPRLRPPGDYVEPIQNTTILGAAKVTGRLRNGLSVGVLTALTARETARTFTTSSSLFSDEEVEPLTQFGVVRLQQEFGKNRSTAAIMLTNVHRFMDSGTPLSSLLTRDAVSAAGEWQLRFKGGEYVFFGYLGMSNVAGDSAALLRIQNSSTHFFQRPDADYVEVDPARKELFGTFTSIGASKNAGRLLWQFNVYGETPGLEINDAGRIGSADDRGFNIIARYRQTVPGKRLRYWDVGTNNFNEWNFGGISQFHLVQLFSNQTWKNFRQTSLVAQYVPRSLSDNLTRGGPLMGLGRSWQLNGGISSNPALKLRWRVTPNAGGDDMGGWTAGTSAGVTINPGTQWELSVDPGYTRWVNPRQFFASRTGGSDATFGRRYIFSRIERSELSARLRLDYALRPDLTLQTYAEPFASSGRYFRHGELPAARSYDLREYGTAGTTIDRFADDSLVVTDGAARFSLPVRDFNVLSFRSNVVLRWEWRPGSTAYLVWQQNRFDQLTSGRLVRPGSLYDALTSIGDNVLAVKVNYWLPF